MKKCTSSIRRIFWSDNLQDPKRDKRNFQDFRQSRLRPTSCWVKFSIIVAAVYYIWLPGCFAHWICAWTTTKAFKNSHRIWKPDVFFYKASRINQALQDLIWVKCTRVTFSFFFGTYRNLKIQLVVQWFIFWLRLVDWFCVCVLPLFLCLLSLLCQKKQLELKKQTREDGIRDLSFKKKPSLKLAVRTWKWVVGRLYLPFAARPMFRCFCC